MIKHTKKINSSNSSVATLTTSGTSKATPTVAKRRKSMLLFTYSIVVLIVILVIVKVGLLSWQMESSIDGNTYQAVALDNGQTFFGRLTKIGGSMYSLNDVYYLQRSTATGDTTDVAAATGTDSTNSNTNTNTNSDSGLQLIPLTDDIQKPQNHLIIESNHIVFWQNLQTNSPILATISQYHTQAK